MEVGWGGGVSLPTPSLSWAIAGLEYFQANSFAPNIAALGGGFFAITFDGA